MTFKPTLWYPVAAVLSLANIAAVGFAAGSAEPWHATAHAALALAFGTWAQRLRQRRLGSETQTRLQAPADLESLEDQMNELRQELSETQERLDFTERLLSQRTEPRRVDPER
jgi:hypothetical protein